MIKHIALLSFICFILSCQSNQRPKPNYAELVKGDWVGQHNLRGSNMTKLNFYRLKILPAVLLIDRMCLKYRGPERYLYLFSDKEDDAK